MKRTLQMVLAKNIALAEIAILSLLAPAALAASVEAHSARKVLDATGVKGGLVVHIGCGDGKLTAALRANDSTIVHGLDIDEANVAAARRTASKAGLYGTVSAARLVGRSLPYADNLVNLVVSENLGKVTMAEVMRVLVPNGAAYVKTGGSWRKTVKPRPAEIDEWTHFLHDASNNAVAADTQVGPPRRLQWTAGPPWCRSHEYISSFSAMVTAGGRVFYVVDEALLGVTDKRLGERWALNARDAFNGALLWKRRLPKWRADEWKGTSMRGRPPSVPRRIVAGGDKLYATLSHLAPVSVIDGATGKTLQMLDGTAGAQEIALVDGTLVMRAVDTAVRGEKTTASIVAVDTETGKVRWRVRAPRYLSQSLAAAGERAVYSDGAQTVCLSLADGKELWRSARPEAKTPPKQQPKAKKKRPRRTRRGDRTIIVHGDLVLETDGGSIIARHARTGKTRWTARTGGGSMRGHDFFIARGLAWHAAKGGISAYDLATGKVVKTIDPSAVQSRGHHLRCYRAKATERYLITQFSGAEFISLTDENHSQNDWVRGPCRHGIMPANGMLYTPPHQCFCFPGAMMTGLNAFTTANDDAMHAIAPSTGAALEKGPAFGTIGNRKSKIANSADWPVYRHDARRTGATPCEVPAKVARLWRAKLVGPLTPPVAAGGRIYVAARNEHTVYALSAADGSVAWRFTADAGVDSPPTVHAGAVLFGCADGRVYCIRASDGALAWRFRAAPAERLIMDEGRLASAWRVHGSVIVQDGVLYCTAGRSSFIDGGLYVYALDPATGKVRHTCRLDTSWATREDKVGDQTQSPKPFLPAFHIQGTRSDLLVAEGGRIYLNQMTFTPELKQLDTPYVAHSDDEKTNAIDVANKPYVAPNPYLAKGFGPAAALGVKRGHMGDQQVGRHLFSTGGLLEDSWFNRTYWMYSQTWPGYQLGHIAPKTGQLLVIGPRTTYAVQAYPTRNIHSPMFTPGSRGYLLLADANDNEPMMDSRSWARDKGMGFTRSAPPKWHQWVPIRMRSMVLAGTLSKKTLFVAGQPDVMDPDNPFAAFDGEKGAVLRAISAADGRKLAEIKLDVPPSFDGMIAANGKLYITMIDGTVMCMGGP